MDALPREWGAAGYSRSKPPRPQSDLYGQVYGHRVYRARTFCAERGLEHIDRNRPSCVPKTGTPVLWPIFRNWCKSFVFCGLHKVAAWRLACEPSLHYGYRIGKLR